MNGPATVGFVGTGHFASYLVEGLCRAGGAPRLVVSPRNAAKAAQLSERFGVEVAGDNQAVVDAADVVILTTRPGVAVEVLSTLRFRPGQRLISMASTLSLARYANRVAPARALRAITTSAAALGHGPVLLFPDEPALHELLSRWGPVEPVPDEAAFKVASIYPVYYAVLFRLIAEGARFGTDNDLEPKLARRLATATMAGAAAMAARDAEVPLDTLIESLATRGGLSEHALRELDAESALAAWRRALAKILDRVRADDHFDECAKCGATAPFTGRIAERPDGRRDGVFHCPVCDEDYPVWRRGL